METARIGERALAEKVHDIRFSRHRICNLLTAIYPPTRILHRASLLDYRHTLHLVYLPWVGFGPTSPLAVQEDHDCLLSIQALPAQNLQ